VGGREPGRGGPELTARDAAPGSGAGSGRSARAAVPPRRHWAEELAERTLAAKGYAVLHRNYRLRGGEIDLVCRAPDGTVVFVEVRQRSSAGHGGAGESLTAAKLGRLRRAAARYLAFELRSPEAPARFDAVLVSGTGPGAVVSHLEDAFR